MREISGLMVAENIKVFRSSGTFSRIAFMLSVNPIFSISSASSSTTVCTPSSFTTPRLIRSIRRPGVATIICTPCRKARIWLSMLLPPYTGSTTTSGMYFEKSARSPAIWRHSSRVGASTSACGVWLSASIRWSNGRPKAAVLPVPVCARATRSWSPLSNTGITFSCTGMGFSKPMSAMPRSRSSLTPNSSNVIYLVFECSLCNNIQKYNNIIKLQFARNK